MASAPPSGVHRTNGHVLNGLVRAPLHLAHAPVYRSARPLPRTLSVTAILGRRRVPGIREGRDVALGFVRAQEGRQFRRFFRFAGVDRRGAVTPEARA